MNPKLAPSWLILPLSWLARVSLKNLVFDGNRFRFLAEGLALLKSLSEIGGQLIELREDDE